MTMRRRIFRHANFLRVILFAAVSISLTGCFDLSQRVAIGRDGGGAYEVTVAAAGLVGQALKEKPAHIDGMPAPQISIDPHTGMVRQTSRIAFKSIAELRLPDELISLHVLERPLFGVAPAHVRFRRTFLIGQAKKQQEADAGRPDELGSQIMASVFGDHVYTFAVTLPGSVLAAKPLHFGNVTVEPVVTGDFWSGHTITWTMPLYLALSRQMLTFEVDFSAYGDFSDVTSQPRGS